MVLAVHPSAELYGSDRVFLDTVAALVEVADRVVVAVPQAGPLVQGLEDAGAEVAIIPMLVIRKALMKPSGWPRLVRDAVSGTFAAWGLVRRERPALVFVNTVTVPLWPVIGRMSRRPVMLHVHEGEQSAAAMIKRVLYAPALAASRILVNSRFSRAVMTSTYPRLAARSEIIPNAVPGPARVLPARPGVSDGLRVVYVGRLSPRKGTDLVLEAVGSSALAGRISKVDIVGSAFTGYEWFERQLHELAVDHGIAGLVEFRGFQSDVWGFLEYADVVVVPSRLDEPFGNTAVEGVLAGRPVVVSDTSGLIEATESVPTVVRVAPGSVDALAAGIRRVHDDWDRFRSQLDEARALVQQRHDPVAYRRRIAASVAAMLR